METDDEQDQDEYELDECSGREQHYLCHGGMRDTMTTVYSYLENPSRLRASCRFFVLCFDHAIYLEVPLPVAYVVSSLASRLAGRLAICPAEQAEGSQGESCSVIHQAAPVINLTKFAPSLADRPIDLHVERLAEETTSLNLSRAISPGSQVQRLTLRDLPSLKRIECRVVPTECNNRLHDVTLEQLPQLQGIMTPCFLAHQANLTVVRLAALATLKTIAFGFLNHATSLRSVTLEDLPHLVSIGDDCIANCSSLKEVRLVLLPNLAKIGHHFLSGCQLVSTQHVFEASVLPRLTHIGPRCLSQSRDLTTLTVKGLPRLSSLGPDFGFGCSQLHELVLQDLPELTAVGFPKTSQTRLSVLRLVNLPKLCDLPSNISVATAHRTIEFNNLPKVVVLPAKAFASSWWLDTFTMKEMAALNVIEQGALSNSNVAFLELRGLPELHTICSGVLANCQRLPEIHLSDLPQLSSIGEGSLSSSLALTKVSLHSLPELQHLRDRVLADCTVLSIVSLKDVPALEWVGADCMSGCPELETLSISGAPKLQALGKGCLKDTAKGRLSITLGANCHDSLATALGRFGTVKQQEDGEAMPSRVTGHGDAPLPSPSKSGGHKQSAKGTKVVIGRPSVIDAGICGRCTIQ